MPVHYKSKGLFSLDNIYQCLKRIKEEIMRWWRLTSLYNSLKRLKERIKELWDNPGRLPPEPCRKSCTAESDPDE